MIDFHEEITGSVIFDEQTYSSDVLNHEIEKIQNNIFFKNLFLKDSVVAIAIPRSVHLVTSILTVLKFGITYLLIDVHEQPKQRIEYMLDNANVDVILSLSTIDYDFGNRKVIFVDLLEADYPSNVNLSFNELAYILYTSGTTGEPKGVEVTKHGLLNFINGITEVISFNNEKNIVSFTNSTFDIFFLEAIMPLYFGMNVILSTEEEQRNPKKAIELLKKYPVHMLQLTPSRLRVINTLDQQLSSLEKVECIMIGGEPFPIDLLKKLQKLTNSKIYNMYGPTETTIWSTVADLTDRDKIDIGRPIQNTQIYLLNNRGEKADEGEICIAGAGLARGYCNNKEQTQMHFSHLPFSPDVKIYKTGDVGKINDEGRLIYLGRKDAQIKIRGYRVELEEIESNMNAMREIELATVCYDENANCMIAFYIANNKHTNSKFTKYLKQFLPSYMIPQKFIKVEQFFYTISGKIDKKKLIEKYKGEFFDRGISEDQINNESKQQILRICSELIQIPVASINLSSPLTELGFNSINYIEFIARIEDTFDIEFDDNYLKIPEEKSCSEYIDECVEEINKVKRK